jgi:N utilization substance protein B
LTKANDLRDMIDVNTKNWELDRIAFMDIVIMEVALAELLDFPTIPVNVTLNEYIEIAKTYSTEKSGTFINGVLDNIVNELKKENKLIKVVMFSDNKK